MNKRKFRKFMKRVVRELQVRGYIKNPYIFDPKQAGCTPPFKPPVTLDASRRYCAEFILGRTMGGNK